MWAVTNLDFFRAQVVPNLLLALIKIFHGIFQNIEYVHFVEKSPIICEIDNKFSWIEKGDIDESTSVYSRLKANFLFSPLYCGRKSYITKLIRGVVSHIYTKQIAVNNTVLIKMCDEREKLLTVLEHSEFQGEDNRRRDREEKKEYHLFLHKFDWQILWVFLNDDHKTLHNKQRNTKKNSWNGKIGLLFFLSSMCVCFVT